MSGLFNNASSSSDSTGLNDMMICK